MDIKTIDLIDCNAKIALTESVINSILKLVPELADIKSNHQLDEIRRLNNKINNQQSLLDDAALSIEKLTVELTNLKRILRDKDALLDEAMEFMQDAQKN